jgi:Secretion system C-terminal sorting domain
MKKLLNLSIFLICFFFSIISLFAQRADSYVQFLEEKTFVIGSCPFVFQPAQCGSKIYEVCVCNVEPNAKTFKVEITIEQLSLAGSFNFTDPMDFTLNTQTGKLETIVTLAGTNDEPNCRILKFAGYSGNGDPKIRLVAEIFENNVSISSDCIVIDGGGINFTDIINNTSVTAILGTSLLPLYNFTPIPPLKRRIEGTFTINQSYTFGANSLLQMGDDAKIVVKSGAVLTISKSQIFGCENMWESIIVEEGGALDLGYSKIRDAKAAVVAVGSASVGINSNKFEDNQIGLLQKSRSNNAFAEYSDFYKKYGLKEGDEMIGIKAEKEAFVRAVGCNFHDINEGIRGLSFSIINSLNGEYNKLDFGIRHTGGSGVSGTSVGGSIVSDGDHFSQINEIGIAAWKTKTSRIDGARMERISKYGIDVNGDTYRPAYAEISNSIISDALVGVRGVESTFDASFSEFNNNDMGLTGVSFLGYTNCTGSNFSSNRPERYAIRTLGGKNKILRNNIYFSDNASQTIGIDLYDNRDSEVRGNYINTNSNAIGVNAIGGTNIDVSCNRFVGGDDNTTNAYFEQTGGKGYTLGNTFDRGEISLAFNGPCIGDVKGNKMSNNHTTTLLIHPNASIGKQVHAGNLFYPEDASTGICNGNTGDSRFIVSARHNDPLCSQVEARIPNNRTQNWFDDKCDPQGDSTYDPYSNCKPYYTKPPKIFTDFDIKIMEDAYQFGGLFGPSMTYITKKQFYDAISKNPSMVENSQIATQFFEQNANSNIGKLYAVSERLSQLASVMQTSNSSNQTAIYKDNLLQIMELSKQIAAATNEEDKNELRSNQQEKVQTATALSAAIEESMAIEDELLREEIIALKAVNDAIEIDNIIDYNERTVNSFCLEAILENKSNFSDEELSEITHIAYQCPLTGGNAVYTARTIYLRKYPNTNFEWSELCNVLFKQQRKVEVTDTKLAVFPNPNTGSFTVNYDLPTTEKISKIHLILTNSVGAIVEEKFANSKQEQVQWNIENIPNGIYFLSLKVDNRILQQQKIVIVK